MPFVIRLFVRVELRLGVRLGVGLFLRRIWIFRWVWLGWGQPNVEANKTADASRCVDNLLCSLSFSVVFSRSLSLSHTIFLFDFLSFFLSLLVSLKRICSILSCHL